MEKGVGKSDYTINVCIYVSVIRLCPSIFLYVWETENIERNWKEKIFFIAPLIHITFATHNILLTNDHINISFPNNTRTKKRDEFFCIICWTKNFCRLTHQRITFLDIRACFYKNKFLW